jgi:hypothetical protein
MRNQGASQWFWNQLGFAIAVLSLGCSWSISRAKVYELELADFKLGVGDALLDVQKVSNSLEKSAERLPIPKNQKRKILNSIAESNVVLDQVQGEIEGEVNELTEELPVN